MLTGHLIYKNTGLIISPREWQEGIIHDVHVGLDNDSKVEAMALHCRRDLTEQKKIGKVFLA